MISCREFQRLESRYRTFSETSARLFESLRDKPIAKYERGLYTCKYNESDSDADQRSVLRCHPLHHLLPLRAAVFTLFHPPTYYLQRLVELDSLLRSPQSGSPEAQDVDLFRIGISDSDLVSNLNTLTLPKLASSPCSLSLLGLVPFQDGKR